MIAAIGSDGTRPVVWGLGDTVEAAIADAADQAGPLISDGSSTPWDSDGSATCAVAPEIVARIEAGEVSCEALGIDVRCDRDGRIVEAAVRS